MQKQTTTNYGRITTTATLAAVDLAEHFKPLPSEISRFDLLKILRHSVAPLGLKGSLMRHLELLVSRTRENDWHSVSSKPLVWLSVKNTADLLGLSREQIRLNEKRLVELGFICHQDYGNHRRFGYRDDDGNVQTAYGIDLSPLGARWQELVELHASKQQEKDKWQALRCELTVLRRRFGGAVNNPDLQSKLPAELKPIEHKAVNSRIKTSVALDELGEMVAFLRDLLGKIGAFVRSLYPKTWHKRQADLARAPSTLGTPYNNYKDNIKRLRNAVRKKLHKTQPPARQNKQQEKERGLKGLEKLSVQQVIKLSPVSLKARTFTELGCEIYEDCHRFCQVRDYQRAVGALGLEKAAVLAILAKVSGAKLLVLLDDYLGKRLDLVSSLNVQLGLGD